MTRLGNFGKMIPTATSVVIVGGWTSPTLAYYPSNFLDQVPSTVPLPPAVIDPIFPVDPPPPVVPPPPVIVPPTVVPPTIVPPTVVPPTEVPPTPIPCTCQPQPPQGVPEPATMLSGLLGLAAVGTARTARRRLWPKSSA